MAPPLKSEVAIVSLFHQIQQTKKILSQVNKILREMGLLSLSNLAIYIKKAVLKLKNDFKREIASKIQFRPTWCIKVQTDDCNQIIHEKTNINFLVCWIFWFARDECKNTRIFQHTWKTKGGLPLGTMSLDYTVCIAILHIISWIINEKIFETRTRVRIHRFLEINPFFPLSFHPTYVSKKLLEEDLL